MEPIFKINFKFYLIFECGFGWMLAIYDTISTKFKLKMGPNSNQIMIFDFNLRFGSGFGSIPKCSFCWISAIHEHYISFKFSPKIGPTSDSNFGPFSDLNLTKIRCSYMAAWLRFIQTHTRKWGQIWIRI